MDYAATPTSGTPIEWPGFWNRRRRSSVKLHHRHKATALLSRQLRCFDRYRGTLPDGLKIIGDHDLPVLEDGDQVIFAT